MNHRFEVLVGDITQSDADAIVNASDEQLSGGGGVDAAIHQVAGPELSAACRAAGACPTGQVIVTPGFRLNAKWIFHTAGPVWHGGGEQEAAKLASCYRNCLMMAETIGLQTLDFCSISTGVFAYPEALAATVAEKAIMDFLQAHLLPWRVRMICRREETAVVYRQVYNLWYAAEKSERL